MTISYQDLKKKDVLEITSGKNLGKITDLIIEKKSGKILKIIVPGKKGCFISIESVEIKFCQIERIGDDAILVNLNAKRDCNDKNLCSCMENACSQAKDFDRFEDD